MLDLDCFVLDCAVLDCAVLDCFVLDCFVLLQLLAMLYKKKQALLNSHILHLTFSLIGTIDSNKEITIIPNRLAFEDLLCDLEVRLSASVNLIQPLLLSRLPLRVLKSRCGMMPLTTFKGPCTSISRSC